MSKSAFLKGSLIMVFFLLFAVVSNLFVVNMDPISFSTYQQVNIENLARNPSKYEGKDISSSSNIISLLLNGTVNQQVITVEYGIVLNYQGTENLKAGTFISFRGKSSVASSNTVEVQEIHVWPITPYLLTVPGVVAFISAFFFIYKVNLERFAFIPRRKENA